MKDSRFGWMGGWMGRRYICILSVHCVGRRFWVVVEVTLDYHMVYLSVRAMHWCGYISL